MILAVLLAACTAVPSPHGSYTVARGDTLSAIAAERRVDMAALARANGIAPPYRIQPGQRLVMPGSGRGPSRLPAPPPARQTYQPPAPPQPSYTQPYAPTVQQLPAPTLAWPGDGAVTSTFGQLAGSGANNGIDLSIHPGQRIIAAAAGTVLFAGSEPQKFGQLVLIDHGGGWITAYGFTGQITVREGEPVTSRERIGVNSRTTRLLHFELRRDNVPRDPLPYLPARL